MSLTKNILIGIFVLIAFAIIIFILLFLHPSPGDNGRTLIVRFTDIDKINIGTRVTYAGLPVGEVVDIKEIPEARTSRINHNGEVYVYQLTLRVDSSVEVYNTDTISIRTSGLLGERNIDIDPRPLKPGEKLVSIDDQIIYAESPPSLENTVRQFSGLAEKLDRIFDQVTDTLNEFKDRNILDRISHAANNVVEITDSLNQPEKWRKTLDNIAYVSDQAREIWPRVNSTIDNIHTFTDKLHHSWDTTWPKIDKTAEELSQTSQNLNYMIAYASSGQGTIGKLFMGDDLYLRVKSILHKGSITMDDVKQYGVLFHLNKQWQRANARRLNMLQKLSTPSQFANYFDDEINNVSNCLSRVSMVLNQAQEYPGSLMNNCEYTEKFADLLRKVEAIEESLKMYNEQVVNQECPCQ